GPDGALPIQSDGQSAINSDDRIAQHVEAGPYFLEVESLGAATGSCTLTNDKKEIEEGNWDAALFQSAVFRMPSGHPDGVAPRPLQMQPTAACRRNHQVYRPNWPVAPNPFAMG